MTSEITIQEKVIVVRNGAKIWLDKTKSDKIEQDLITGDISKFIKVEDRLLNINDITGIYLPKDLNDIDSKRHYKETIEEIANNLGGKLVK